MKFFTIGIYHRTKSEFFGALEEAQIQLFCDIRRRRGIRGKQYAFGNSKLLQKRLDGMGIAYWHLPELAPTTAMVHRQDQIDGDSGISRRDRRVLSSEFVEEYKREILSEFDVDRFLHRLSQTKVEKVILFCLEREAAACHRSLVAEILQLRGFDIEHL